MAARGRTTKYNQARAQLICDALRLGVPREAAARCAAIDDSTMYSWMKRYPEFAGRVEMATAQFEADRALIVSAAGAKHWTAAAWMLERRYPERWGRRQVLEVDGANRPAGPSELRVIIERVDDAILHPSAHVTRALPPPIPPPATPTYTVDREDMPPTEGEFRDASG